MISFALIHENIHFERGFLELTTIEPIFTSEWGTNKEVQLKIKLPQNGIYRLDIGFILPYEDHIEFLYLENNMNYLDLGWMDLN